MHALLVSVVCVRACVRACVRPCVRVNVFPKIGGFNDHATLVSMQVLSSELQ